MPWRPLRHAKDDTKPRRGKLVRDRVFNRHDVDLSRPDTVIDIGRGHIAPHAQDHEQHNRGADTQNDVLQSLPGHYRYRSSQAVLIERWTAMGRSDGVFGRE